MIGFLLAAAHITTCLIYSHFYSAIAIPHVQQSRFTLQSTPSSSSSLHFWLLTPGTLKYTVGTHSLHSTITLWLSHYCTLYWLLYIHSLAHCHWLVLLTTDSVFYAHWLILTNWYCLLNTARALARSLTLTQSQIHSLASSLSLTAFSLVGSLI
jgi:hypothetical protein